MGGGAAFAAGACGREGTGETIEEMPNHINRPPNTFQAPPPYMFGPNCKVLQRGFIFGGARSDITSLKSNEFD